METILVLHDLTAASEAALTYAAELNQYLKFHLKVLHVVEMPEDLGTAPLEQHPFFKTIPKELEAITERIQNKYDMSVSFQLEKGELFKKIGETAQDSQVKLVIMTTHGVQGIQLFSGSFAGKVLHEIASPALVIQNETTFSNITDLIVPIDNPREIEEVRNWISKLQGLFNSHVHFVKSKSFGVYHQRTTEKAYVDLIQTLKANGTPFTEHESNVNGKEFADFVIETGKQKNHPLYLIEQEEQSGRNIIGSFAQRLITNEQKMPVVVLHPSI